MQTEIRHASSVALGGAGLLILGPSGSGKSELALRLMAYGAELVADDRTALSRPDDGPPLLAAPPAIAGMIEARGVGLLAAAPRQGARLALCVDLGRTEPARLPEPRAITILGYPVALLHKPERGDLAPALLQYLKGAPCSP